MSLTDERIRPLMNRREKLARFRFTRVQQRYSYAHIMFDRDGCRDTLIKKERYFALFIGK